MIHTTVSLSLNLKKNGIRRGTCHWGFQFNDYIYFGIAVVIWCTTVQQIYDGKRFVFLWEIQLITHAGCIAAGVGKVFSRVCLSVCPRSKRSYQHQKLVHINTIVVSRHAFIQRSKGQGHAVTKTVTVAIYACCYSRVLLLPAWVCMPTRLPMFSSF